MDNMIVTGTGPSGRGLIAAVAACLADAGCNILDSAQFNDEDSGRFFLRMVVRSETGTDRATLAAKLAETGARTGLDLALHGAEDRMRVVVMVSRFGHCLNDLLYRWRIGALPIEIVAVISNHTDYARTVEGHDLPFHHIPVTKATKAEAEARQLDVITDAGADLVVLARYMQVLSDALCQRMSGRLINIHHSFLPSFKGAVPYRQAFDKGVKLIGATAHFVTADLDEGPIIEQDTVRVTHAQSAEDFVALGRDVEAQVLSRAVHAYADRRVLPNGDKTVVFPASPGAFASDRMG
ncbi:putative formyltetrahydrofolate deformylase [Oceaniovalibus guishaninsula JLT2003]|uniref:Formyltetrahydrofolate deformylase n=1 Tax=Oceaniovalibus guishaninsula JLT2003 TaxID=1231392 RepID=K2GQA9_9RHOB|nr:formyltetrahydrofolate deformylase [Oceaniovalibus guishaninsula]EKE44856.1 putative formyltetrahydrofolate deformylase [Oceaniovalibus guishaninsula JLT2003]